MKTLQRTALALAAFAGTAQAHEGHGMPTAVHWHATDVAGLAIAIGAAAFVIWWLSRGE